MKYIMLKVIHNKENPDGQLMPFIFPEYFNHDEMSEMCKHQIMRTMPHIKTVTIRSAGFINSLNNECHGESITLKVKSHQEDTDVINVYDYSHGLL